MIQLQNNSNSYLTPKPFNEGPFGDNADVRKLKDIDKTLFLRTSRKLDDNDFEVLYFLNLFGLKYILNDELGYAHYMQERMDLQQMDADDQDPVAAEAYQQ